MRTRTQEVGDRSRHAVSVVPVHSSLFAHSRSARSRSIAHGLTPGGSGSTTGGVLGAVKHTAQVAQGEANDVGVVQAEEDEGHTISTDALIVGGVRSLGAGLASHEDQGSGDDSRDREQRSETQEGQVGRDPHGDQVET
jgi:hypothetical protein